MTNTFNIDEIKRAAQLCLDQNNVGKEFMISDVCNITRAAYDKYPEDPVISQVAFTIEKMANRSSPGALISQANMSQIYNEFVCLAQNSHFKSELGFLLLDKKIDKLDHSDYIRTNRASYNGVGITNEDLADQADVAILSDVFNNKMSPVQAFNTNVAQNGIQMVQAELKYLGFDITSVEVADGNQDFIIYNAGFDTRAGKIVVAIPAEINNGKVLFPSTFVSDNNIESLTHSNLKTFIDKKANFVDSSIDRSVVLPYISDISVNVPNELAHIAHDFEESAIEAASSFGPSAIVKGKEIIARELSIAGFKNSQVKFGNESNGSIIYLASINTPRGAIEIEVPVEMQRVNNGYIPLAPSYFAYDSLIEDFTAPKLQRFAISIKIPATGMINYSSSLSYITLPEIKDEILKSASVGDYVSCEAALLEIQDRFQEEDFKNAVADYHFILMEQAKMSNQTQHVCSKMIAAGKGSIYKRCGHFLVPMNKVVADANGECRLKASIERERLNPVEESGALINSAKIFMS